MTADWRRHPDQDGELYMRAMEIRGSHAKGHGKDASCEGHGADF